MHRIICQCHIINRINYTVLCFQASPDELSDLSCDEKTSKMLEDPTNMVSFVSVLIEPRHEKTDLREFRPGPTQTGLCTYRRWLDALNFGFRKKRNCTKCVAKTKALISCAVTAQLICAFVFA